MSGISTRFATDSVIFPDLGKTQKGSNLLQNNKSCSISLLPTRCSNSKIARTTTSPSWGGGKVGQALPDNKLTHRCHPEQPEQRMKA